MNGGKRPLGYTIVEVMIVLAVSGFMFVIAATFISGKQESASFTEGSNEFASQLQLLISQVQDGQYSGVTFGCTYDQATNSINIHSAVIGPNSSQGTNSQCDFLGKFAHFSENNDPTQYEVFSLAGGRQDSTLGSAAPIVGGTVDLTVQQQTPQSLQVKDMQVIDAAGNTHNTWGLGFVQSTENCQNDICPTSAQTLEMVFTPNLDGAAGQTKIESGAVTAITGSLQKAAQATICLTDGNRYAQITLGAGNGSSPFNVAEKVFLKPYVPNPPC